MNDYQFAEGALNDLKNNAILLTMANEHLRDDIYLAKIADSINRASETLKTDILDLKKEYPGKFMNEPDTDAIFEKMEMTTQRMLAPDKDIKVEYAGGQLGKEIQSYVMSLSKAVNDLKNAVHGLPADQQKKHPETGLLGKIRYSIHLPGDTLLLAGKIFSYIIILIAAIFCFLYFTMENDTTLLNEMTSSQELVKERKALIPKLEQEKEVLYKKRKTTKSKDMTREEKVAALNLEMEIKKLEDNLEQIAAEISINEKKINDTQEKLEAFRKKPFIKKLLKQ
jgi:hypothetical protein